MSFENLCADIKKLSGKTICSIKPGSNLVISKIDEKSHTIEIIDKKGKTRTRPLSELKKIWNELKKGEPVHVDSVLGGSGSSRNQPETVLANLPYVEWLSIHGKKHLFFVRENTHAFGTLMKMDSLKVQNLLAKKVEKEEQRFSSIIIFNDIFKATQIIGDLTASTPLPLSEGTYSIRTPEQHILLVSQKETCPSIPCSSYPVLYGNKKDLDGFPFLIKEKTYQLISILGNRVFYSSE